MAIFLIVEKVAYPFSLIYGYLRGTDYSLQNVLQMRHRVLNKKNHISKAQFNDDTLQIHQILA